MSLLFVYFQIVARQASHSIYAAPEHCSCMVEFCGCAGHLLEAEDMIKAMPFKQGAGMWKALLGARRISDNVEMGKHVAKHVLEVDLKNSAAYMLSNIYLAAVSIRAPSWLLSYHGPNFGRYFFQIFCTGGAVVVGWRR